MAITNKQIAYWGTIALIAFFVLEFFWPLMYSQNNAAQAQTPSPTTAASFVGMAVANARVLYFASDGLIICNSSDESFTQKLRSTPGVTRAFAASDVSYFFQVNASDENASAGVFKNVSSFVASDCGENATVLRRAGLQLESDNFSFQSTASLSDSRTLYKRDILDAFRAAGDADANGLVDLSVGINDSVNVVIVARLLGNQIYDKPQIIESSFVNNVAQ